MKIPIAALTVGLLLVAGEARAQGSALERVEELSRTGRTEEALGWARLLLELDPGNAEVRALVESLGG